MERDPSDVSDLSDLSDGSDGVDGDAGANVALERPLPEVPGLIASGGRGYNRNISYGGGGRPVHNA